MLRRDAKRWWSGGACSIVDVSTFQVKRPLRGAIRSSHDVLGMGYYVFLIFLLFEYELIKSIVLFIAYRNLHKYAYLYIINKYNCYWFPNSIVLLKKGKRIIRNHFIILRLQIDQVTTVIKSEVNYVPFIF